MDDTRITLALCEMLGEVPGWHWSPSEATPAGQVGIVYGDLPVAPDRAIGVSVYGGTDDALVYRPMRRVQLRVRGAREDKQDADRIAGFAFALLQGRSRIRGLSWIERQTFGPLGTDGNGREERTENYLIYPDNPGAST